MPTPTAQRVADYAEGRTSNAFIQLVTLLCCAILDYLFHHLAVGNFKPLSCPMNPTDSIWSSKIAMALQHYKWGCFSVSAALILAIYRFFKSSESLSLRAGQFAFFIRHEEELLAFSTAHIH